MRLDRLLSSRKFGTRKEVTSMIKKGHVQVNGTIEKKASKHIDHNIDEVLVDGIVVPRKEYVTLMMNKPSGVVSANHDALHKTVIDLLDEPYTRYDLHIAGRLDIDTEGLIILTNDGQYIHRLISAKKNVFKKYYVKVDKPFLNIDVLNTSYLIKDGKGELFQPKKALLKQIDNTTFEMSISEGKFHQVKRMVEYFGYQVVYLKRLAIGDIVLDETLEPGEYIEL